MIKYLALIPARGGSKGVPKKNLYPLAGKPLIQYTFESALQSSLVNEIHLSSDSQEIIDFAEKFGVQAPYVRPLEISSDTASALDVILFHINWLKEKKNVEVENIVYLQPTSPIRGKSLIDDAIKQFETMNSESMVAICECTQHPYETVSLQGEKMIRIQKEGSFSRRQDYPDFYFITGALYLFKTDFILRHRKIIDDHTNYIITSKEEGIDIDDLLDIKIAELIL